MVLYYLNTYISAVLFNQPSSSYKKNWKINENLGPNRGLHRIQKSIFVKNYYFLTLWAPTLQNGQTHSNNSLATANELFEYVDHFVGLDLKRLKFINLKDPHIRTELQNKCTQYRNHISTLFARSKLSYFTIFSRKILQFWKIYGRE